MALSQSEIDDAARNPKKMSGDEGSVEERSIDELIAAKREAEKASSLAQPHRGIYFSKAKPFGSVQ